MFEGEATSYRVEIHSDDLMLLRQFYSPDWRVTCRYFDNKTGKELSLEDVFNYGK